MYDYDLIIIGSGPSGRAAAIQAGKLKRRVLVIDRRDRPGGVSVHTGTIPSKMLRETVLNQSGWRERSLYGRAFRARDSIGAGDLMARLHKTLDYEVDALAALPVADANTPAAAFCRATGGQEDGRFRDSGQLWRSENPVMRWDLDGGGR